MRRRSLGEWGGARRGRMHGTVELSLAHQTFQYRPLPIAAPMNAEPVNTDTRLQGRGRNRQWKRATLSRGKQRNRVPTSEVFGDRRAVSAKGNQRSLTDAERRVCFDLETDMRRAHAQR